MKVISKEEEEAHYSQVIKGGLQGGGVGLGLGLAGVLLASRRYAGFRNLTLPFRSFLVTSSGTFGAIVWAERRSNQFLRDQDPMSRYKDESQRAIEAARASSKSPALDWARDHRYTMVLSSWAASIGIALALVGRNKYLTTSQKIVQSRVYAQGLTLLVLIATGLLEAGDARSGKGRWETVMVVDPDDPEHKHMIEKQIHKEEYAGQDLWKDMVAAEERRLAAQKKQANESPSN